MQPHRRHLLQPLEAEGVELEGGAAVFAVFKDGHGAVGGAADGRQRQESTHSSLSSQPFLALLCHHSQLDLYSLCQDLPSV